MFLLCVGFILHSGILCFFGFWLFHLAHLFFSLAFPFKAKQFMSDYGKIAHIVEVIVVILLCTLPGAIIIGTSQYRIDRYPPDICVPSDPNVFFYSFSLTIAIGSTIGLAMLFTTFTVLRRVSAIYVCIYIRTWSMKLLLYSVVVSNWHSEIDISCINLRVAYQVGFNFVSHSYLKYYRKFITSS